MIHLSIATERDLAECARLLAEVFEEDHVIARTLPGERNRVERLRRYFVNELRHGAFAHGQIDIARLDPAGPILGMAAWEAPGAKQTPWQRLWMAAHLLRATGPCVLQARAAKHEFVKEIPDFPHWFLADIAVSSRARGTGIGSALLAHRTALIDASGAPAYLEATTPGSRRLYERHGFHLLTPMEWHDENGSPFTMLREPQPPAR